MKTYLRLFTFLIALFAVTTAAYAQNTPADPPIQHGPGFVDNDGDGYNDRAPDADGDGIPNGLDDDYVGPRNGRVSRGFVDKDGDGINDNAPAWGSRGARQRGGNFVDKDGDGYNDNKGMRQGAGRGRGIKGNGQAGAGRMGKGGMQGACNGGGPAGGRGQGNGRNR